MADSEDQATNPFSDSFFDKLEKGILPKGGRKADPPPPEARPQVANVVADIFAEGTPGHARSRRHIQERLQRDLGFGELELEPNIRGRLIFKHSEGNYALDVSSEETRVISAKPRGGATGADKMPSIELLGVTQSRSEIGCSLRASSIGCHFYYMPLSNNVLLYNTGDLPLSLACLSEMRAGHEVAPGREVVVTPATWKLSDAKTRVDLHVMPRQFALRVEEAGRSVKRSAEEALPPAKKATRLTKTPALSSAGPAGSTAQNRAIRASDTSISVWPGVNIRQHQSVQVADTVTGTPEYSLERLDGWAHRTHMSHTFKALLHDGSPTPQAIVVKIMLPSSPSQSDIRAARAWQREFSAHRGLQHPRIASLRGYDSRILSLYVDLKPSMDLSSPRWCGQQSDKSPGYFRGESPDAVRILTDISSALAYLKEQGIVHNDIRPSNILYTPAPLVPSDGPFEGGATLVDFGLAGSKDEVSSGGTPWYVAPEYMEQQRGPPADVYALGVVMLYVLRCCVIPDKFFFYHGKHCQWMIARVCDKGSTALEDMKSWLEEVDKLRDMLEAAASGDEGARLRRLVRMMLLTLDERITAEDLSKAMKEFRRGRNGH